jgi:hypothetical protein
LEKGVGNFLKDVSSGYRANGKSSQSTFPTLAPGEELVEKRLKHSGDRGNDMRILMESQ